MSSFKYQCSSHGCNFPTTHILSSDTVNGEYYTASNDEVNNVIGKTSNQAVLEKLGFHLGFKLEELKKTK